MHKAIIISLVVMFMGSLGIAHSEENGRKSDNNAPWSIDTPMQGYIFLGGTFGNTGFGIEGGAMINEKLSFTYRYNTQHHSEGKEINNKPVNKSQNHIMIGQYRIAGSAAFGGAGLRIARNMLETATQSVEYRPVLSIGIDTKGIERKLYIAAQLILSTDVENSKRNLKSYIFTSLGYKF